MASSSSLSASSLQESTESIGLNSSVGTTSHPTTSLPRISKSTDRATVSQTSSPNTDSKEAFLDFCQQYAPYMQYSALFDREVAASTEAIAALTSRTDENGLLMDPLSTATAHRAEVVIPILKERASHLSATFDSIDKLQELINKLKQNVNEAQIRVEEAEQSYSSLPSVSKIFGVFSRKDKSSTDKPAGPFRVIDVKAEISLIRTEMKATK